MGQSVPKAFDELLETMRQLGTCHDMQDIQFTVEDGRLCCRLAAPSRRPPRR